MRNVQRLLAALLFVALLLPATAGAFGPYDTTVVIPIIGRFPGALESQWKTDLFISNHYSVAKTVTMTFYVAGSAPLVRSVEIGPYSNVGLPDIVLNTFGLSNASGQLILHPSVDSRFEARARIYNTASAAGEFGQSAPGSGVNRLFRQAYMYGLSGLGGNRVNVGIANPNETAISVNLSISDHNGAELHYETITVQPHQTTQFNDIFSRFGIAPQADVQVEFSAASDVFYGYASEVRNDSGDAIFIFGTAPNVSPF